MRQRVHYHRAMPSPSNALTRWISGLRFPWLAGLAAAALVADLIIPDVVPLVDELILAAVTIGLASWRRKRSGS